MGNAKQVAQEHANPAAELPAKVVAELLVKVPAVQHAKAHAEAQESNGEATSFCQPHSHRRL